jgi:hypothetical protein
MRAFLIMSVTVLLGASSSALDGARIIETTPGAGAFPIVDATGSASIWLDKQEWPGVVRAAQDFRVDIGRVTGTTPELMQSQSPIGKDVILVGTLGRSPVIESIVRSGKIDVSSIRGRWESTLIQVVSRPVEGVDRALVIVGSDKRGTIYGLYTLSEQCGVSPWYWWADVPPKHHPVLGAESGPFIQGPPAVRYRGIFLNDEAPALSGWAREKFGGLNHAFYTNVFELLLRLRANYLWPAMWNNSFATDDRLNAQLADEYGIVIGTSHHEPMMRAWKEWTRAGNPAHSWDYSKNATRLREYWTEGLKRTKDFEKIITLGMRGDGDEPMSETESVALLESIVADQRRIISKVISPDVAAVPQVWALYKEVQGYFERGMRVPDDVTLLWCDDNWGNLRRLPTAEEQLRPGGAGIYYHFDYVGGPRNYKWLNTIPLPKVWEQMRLAFEHKADRIWVVNVGDLKPMEIPIEFFLTFAWNPQHWSQNDVRRYLELWAEREFGREQASEIADLVATYTKYNGRRKPELLEPGTFNLVNYAEADRIAAEWQTLLDRAEKVAAKLPDSMRDAFFELVLHPVKACGLVNQLYIAAAKNQLYVAQGRASANAWATRVRDLFAQDAQLTDYYHHQLAGGKWNHMMSQTHIGYASWQEPRTNNIPAVREIAAAAAGSLGVAVEGSTSAWPGAPESPALPPIERFGQPRRYIEIFNRGRASFDFDIVPSESWLKTSVTRGTLTNDMRVWLSVDWNLAPAGSAKATVRISGPNGISVLVDVTAFNPPTPLAEQVHGFVEADGYIAMDAAHFSRSQASTTAHWELLPDHGRTDSAMTVFPMVAPRGHPPNDSARLEYDTYFFTSGNIEVDLMLSPSLNYDPSRGVQIGLSIDEQAPAILTAVPRGYSAGDGNADWETTVRNSVRRVVAKETLSRPGPHVVKVWMVDPGVVLERIVINTGGLRPSYLGPPESVLK